MDAHEDTPQAPGKTLVYQIKFTLSKNKPRREVETQKEERVHSKR